MSLGLEAEVGRGGNTPILGSRRRQEPTRTAALHVEKEQAGGFLISLAE